MKKVRATVLNNVRASINMTWSAMKTTQNPEQFLTHHEQSKKLRLKYTNKPKN